MNYEPAPAGIALLCDPQGIVQVVLLDGMGLDGVVPGQSLEKAVDHGSRIKLLNFLVEVRGRGNAFNWEINFPGQGRLVTLRMAGMLAQDSLMIVAARAPYDALVLSDEFLKINPVEGAAFHTLLKQNLQPAAGLGEQDGSVYDEITRLNNELFALQRELAKKNAELEQRVLERSAQLKSIIQELEAFSYSISHELRSPLRSIDGWSLVLLEDYQDLLDDTGRQTIRHIRSETQRMAELIDDLLRLSGVNQAEIRWVPVNLSTRVQAIAAHLQSEQPAHPVDWVIQPGLTVQGDPDLLEIMLTNLLSNAFKFSGKVAHPRIEFGMILEEGTPVYFVRDNGAGFDMAYARNLFSAFHSMHKQSDFPGIGAGLAIAQRIINRHGGKIWAQAQVDHGATFYFRLLEKK